MSSPQYLCHHCGAAFGVLRGHSVHCPSCNHSYELPGILIGEEKRLLPEWLNQASKDSAVIGAKMEELKRSLEISKNRASDRRMKIAEQQKQIQRLQEERKELRSQIEASGSGRGTGSERVDSEMLGELQIELQRLTAEYQATTQLIELLNQQVEETQSSLAKTTEEWRGETRQREAVQTALDEATRQANEVRSELARVIEESARIKREAGELKHALERLELENRRQREQLEHLGKGGPVGDGTSSSEDVLQLKHENEQVRSQLVEVRLELVTAKEGMVAAQAQTAALQEAIQERETRIEKLNHQLTAGEKEQDRLFDQYQEMQQHYQAVNKRLEERRLEMETKRSQHAELQAEVEELNGMLAEANATLAKHEEEARVRAERAEESLAEREKRKLSLNPFRLVGRKE